MGAKAVLAPAWQRQGIINQMREYIRSVPVETLIENIKQIDSPAVLRHVMAAGVPAGAYVVLLEQIERVGR